LKGDEGQENTDVEIGHREQGQEHRGGEKHKSDGGGGAKCGGRERDPKKRSGRVWAGNSKAKVEVQLQQIWGSSQSQMIRLVAFPTRDKPKHTKATEFVTYVRGSTHHSQVCNSV